MKYIHFTVGLRPPYEALGDAMKYIYFTVGLCPPYEVFWVDAMNIFTLPWAYAHPTRFCGDVMNIFI